MKRLDLELTERARAYMDEYLSAYAPESVLALNYGPKRWRSLVVTKAQAEGIEAVSGVTGEAIYATNDGVRLFIPEPGDIGRLSGKTLDVIDDVFIANDRAS